MKQVLIIGMLAVALLVGHSVFAQTGEESVDTQELQRELEDAKKRLDEVAREIAELSGRLAGESIAPFVQSFGHGGRKAMLGINLGGPAGFGDKERRDGLEIYGVTPDGPADRAGLQTGDVLLSLNGESLAGAQPGAPMRILFEQMRKVEPGDAVAIDYDRDGERRTVSVVAAEMKPPSFAFRFDTDELARGLEGLKDLEGLEDLEGMFEHHSEHGGPHRAFAFKHGFFHDWQGMELASLTPQLGAYFGTEQGVLVVRAPEDEAMRLQDGDVILRIAGEEVTHPAEVMRELRAHPPGETVPLEIIRQREGISVDTVIPQSEGAPKVKIIKRIVNPETGEVEVEVK